jgi:hypothetical protein
VTRLRAALIARGARAVPVARPRRSKTKRIAMTLVPVALAAELAAFAFLGTSENPNPLSTQRAVIDDSVVSTLPVMHTEIDTGDVVVTPPVAKLATMKAVRDSITRRDTSVASNSVGVTPRAGQRYAVITTSDPRITVVWLTKGDTL